MSSLCNVASTRPVRVAGAIVIALSLCFGATAQTPKANKTTTKRKTPQSERLQERVFQSAALGREMKYRILLPAAYSESSRSFPVLYLLHGWHGDFQNWSTLTNLTHYAERLPIIVVMPDAGDSWYVNSATVPQDKFEQYIAEDLVKDVDQHWRTLRSSHRRAIAGLSMGGYGAVKFALKYPAMFRFAGSISGAFNASLPELEQSRTDLAPSLVSAFGPSGSAVRAENNVFTLAEKAPAQLPYLYVDCGNRDVSFLQSNRDLASLLSKRNIPYEYHETPGAHSWQYWDDRLPDLLAATVKVIARGE